MSKLALIAEDEAAISLALEDSLRDAGFRIAGPFAHCARALEWLTAATPDVALLDVELADGPCTEVALTLQERAVPIVFFSAGGAHDPQMRNLVPEAVWFQKPTNYRDVVDALHGLTA